MNNNFLDPSEEFLDSAFSSLRDRPIPDGPSDELLAKTIESMRRAAMVRPNFFRRVGTKMFTLKMAASVLMVIGLGVVAAVVLRPSSNIFGEIVERVRSAHTMSFEVGTAATDKTPANSMKMIMNDAGQMCGIGADGTRMVWDFKRGRCLILEPKAHAAVIMDIQDLPAESAQPGDLIEGFKSLQGDNAKDLGAETIDGKGAEKFLAIQDRMEYTVWADRHTSEPIRIDIAINMLGKKITASMTDFQFNVDIPDGWLRMDIPDGYTTQRFSVQVPDINKGEENLVDLLRGYAERSGGKFPANLDDMGLYIKLIAAKGQATQPTIQQADMQWLINFQMVQHFISTLPKDGWKYLGDGKMVEGGKSLIFWYRKDAGYRGIYSNLTAVDLPGAPK